MGLDNKRIVFEKDENGREEPESVDVEGDNSLSIFSNSNLQSINVLTLALWAINPRPADGVKKVGQVGIKT